MKLKNKIKLLGLVFILALLFLSNKVLAVNTIDVKVNGTMDYTKAQEVLKLVNEERKATNSNSTSFMNIGNEGSYIFGIKNKSTDLFYSVGGHK